MDDLQERIRKSVERRLGKLFAPPKGETDMGLFEGTPLTEAEVRENAIKTDHCAWCGKVVVWGTFPKSGKRASCERSRYGMLILSDEGFWTPYRNEHGDRQRYLTHWELCPRADEARAADKDFGETE